jgi:phosphoglycerate kinase
MKSFRTLDEARVAGKRVLLRVDLNVPVENGHIADATRIDRILPTINEIAGKGGKIVLLSHFGRPKGPDSENSLRKIGTALAAHLGRPVTFVSDCLGAAAAAAIGKMADGDIVLLENTRFHPGEEKNDPDFVGALAKFGDIYVNDAFSAAHRAHASTEGLAHRLPAYAGRSMQAEIEALEQVMDDPQRPLAAIVGGAKVSGKLDLLSNLTRRVDFLVIGGAMANTFLYAEGRHVGRSLCEKDLAQTARQIVATAHQAKCEIVLPLDAVVAQEFKAHAHSHVVAIDRVGESDMILDIGPRSLVRVEEVLRLARTLLWNGPLGAFEIEPFDAGTRAVAKLAADLTDAHRLVSVAGGGDTVSALNQLGAGEHFTYLSTAGGAFLEWLEGKSLPGVEVLRRH